MESRKEMYYKIESRKEMYYKMESRKEMASCSVTPLAKKVVVFVEERLSKRLCPPLEPSLACKQWVPAMDSNLSSQRQVMLWAW